MNRLVTTLLLVMLIQCGITAAVFWPAPQTGGSPAMQAPRPLERGLIDEVRIGDEYDNETVLRKIGGRWLLPELEGLPADPDKVEQLLQGVTSQAPGWPVARSSAARQRFQVADYYYQRRLTLLGTDQPLRTTYLGTSPGFRKVHARNKGEDAIYSIALNVFDAPATSGAWVDPRLLQVRTPTGIAADSYSLHLDNGEWISGAGHTPDPRELEALISSLRTLQIDGVAAQDLQRELSQAEAELILQILSLAGETTLELFRLDSKHFIKSSEYPLFFSLSRYDFDRLTGIDLSLISPDADSQ